MIHQTGHVSARREELERTALNPAQWSSTVPTVLFSANAINEVSHAPVPTESVNAPPATLDIVVSITAQRVPMVQTVKRAASAQMVSVATRSLENAHAQQAVRVPIVIFRVQRGPMALDASCIANVSMESATRRLENAFVILDSMVPIAQRAARRGSMESLVSSPVIHVAPGTRAPSKPESVSVLLVPKEPLAIKNATPTSTDSCVN